MDDSLRDEAAAIHRALFGRELPDDLARRYVEAHAHALRRVTDAERDWMARARGSDLEALEVALRKRGGDHVLCRKFRLMTALSEASPEYYDDFVNETSRRFTAWAALAWHGLRSVLKTLKGRILLSRIGA
ncbi:MAG TPA: hypothetical protein VEN81_07185 [Planctomycetota bacterium]|nr:hypothetical protein [Planctomycetota bacterium]